MMYKREVLYRDMNQTELAKRLVGKVFKTGQREVLLTREFNKDFDKAVEIPGESLVILLDYCWEKIFGKGYNSHYKVLYGDTIGWISAALYPADEDQ